MAAPPATSGATSGFSPECNRYRVRIKDTVIVAARDAYAFYFEYAAYVCQPNRSFRDGLTRLGFYSNKEIKREVPAIVHPHEREVLFTPRGAERLEAWQPALANLVRRTLADRTQEPGPHGVILLTPHDDPRTLVLPRAVPHVDRGPWTRSQRYVDVEKLLTAGTTRAL